ncbi:unnamed protein product [Discula destructiva]
MYSFRAALPGVSRRTTTASASPKIRFQHEAKRHYINTPFTTHTNHVAGSGLPIIFAGSGAAGVLGLGLYVLGRDKRPLQHNDHNAQMALNPKRKYRDSKSTRWVDWHVKQ